MGGPTDANGWPLLVEAVDLCFSGVQVFLLILLGCLGQLAFFTDQCCVYFTVRHMPFLGVLPALPMQLTAALLLTCCLAGVGCTVVQAGRRGGNLFQNAESGWRLHWRRPLQQELRGEQPTVGGWVGGWVLVSWRDCGEEASAR